MNRLALVPMRERWEGWIGLVAAAAVVAALPPSLFPTYDDGWNLHQLDRLSQGDWRELWHHGAPLFYLFFLPFYKLGAGYTTLSYLNAGLGLAGLGLLGARTLGALARLEEKVALAFLTLAAPLAWVNLFCLTVEAGGLLGLGLGLNAKSTRGRAALLAAAALWNYKLALALAVCLVYDLIQSKDRRRILKDYALGAGGLGLVVYLLYLGLAGVAEGWRPPGTYWGLLGRNASAHASGNRWDVFFYLRYLLDWDAWQWWVAGSAGWWMMHRRKLWSREAWLVLAILGASVLLPKAPRWLLPTLPLLAGWALGMAGRIPNVWLRRLALAGFVWGGYSVNRQAIYAYLPEERWEVRLTQSRALTDTLTAWAGRKETKGRFLTSNGSTLPYLAEAWRGRTRVWLGDAHPCSGLALADGYTYLLGGSPGTPIGPVVAEMRIPTNAVPLLWLEHAEYTGMGYTETMRRWEQYHQAATRATLVQVACP